MVIVAGKGYVVPERRAEYLTGCADLIQRARSDAGCLDYVLAADPVEPGRVNVFELWESGDHLAAHRAAVAQEVGQLAAEPFDVDMTEYEVNAVHPVGR